MYGGNDGIQMEIYKADCNSVISKEESWEQEWYSWSCAKFHLLLFWNQVFRYVVRRREDAPCNLWYLIHMCTYRNLRVHTQRNLRSTDPTVADVKTYLHSPWITHSHHRVQNGSGAHPASYPMGNRGSYPGGKAARGVKLTTHLHLAPRSKNAWSYTSAPPTRIHGVVLSKKKAEGQLYHTYTHTYIHTYIQTFNDALHWGTPMYILKLLCRTWRHWIKSTKSFKKKEKTFLSEWMSLLSEYVPPEDSRNLVEK
jgi:hypothetical protein